VAKRKNNKAPEPPSEPDVNTEAEVSDREDPLAQPPDPSLALGGQHVSVVPRNGSQTTDRSFIVELPSQGIPYGDELPDGKLALRPMTTREESILYSAGEGTTKIASVINSCVASSFDPMHLLMVDRFYILLALRVQSLGPEYTAMVKCRWCNQQWKAPINIIEDLDKTLMEEDVEEPFDCQLPKNGSTVSLRFLRGVDEDKIAKRAKKVRLKSNDPGDPSYLYRLALQIVAIDGEVVDEKKAEKFVATLDMGDSNAIRAKVDEVEGGVDTTLFLECPHCGSDNETQMPFDTDFFRPTAR